MDPITLDSDLAKQLESGMHTGEAIELPFPVIYLWALNGQPSYKSTGGALYNGGWACKAEDLQALCDQQRLATPAGWKHAVIATRDGGEFEAVTTRSVIVAPIAFRTSWLLDSKRFPEYVEGGRRHVQLLAMLGMRTTEGGPIDPWNPVVLTAKGYQAKNLMGATETWSKFIGGVRMKIAPNVPSWCFYTSVGTFGERVSLNVGKPGAQSPITPIIPYLPDNLDEAMLSRLFVGQDTATAMGKYLTQATEWLKAWKEADVDQFAAGRVQDAEGVYIPDEPVDEIPF